MADYDIYEFSNGQTEKRHKDGTLDITFPDGTKKMVRKDYEEIHFADGKYQKTQGDMKTIHHVDGTKEVWEGGMRTKFYTNGIVKVVHQDGRQETKWPDGHVRIKNKDGIVQNV